MAGTPGTDPIRNIFFDLDHTLWDYDRNARHALLHLHTHLGLETWGFADAAGFADAFLEANNAVWELFHRAGMEPETLRLRRLEMVFEAFGLLPQDIPGFHPAFLEHCSQGKALFPNCLPVLAELNKNHVLHIITNGFAESQERKLRFSGIRDYFSTITTSDETGSRKPQPDFFMKALQKAGAKASESLMIGDGWEADILGARSVGIRSIWFNPGSKPCPLKDQIQVRDLSELPGLIMKLTR